MFWNKEARTRGSALGAEWMRGATREHAGAPYVRRIRFPTDKPSLVGRHVPLTLAERLKLERWCRSAD